MKKSEGVGVPETGTSLRKTYTRKPDGKWQCDQCRKRENCKQNDTPYCKQFESANKDETLWGRVSALEKFMEGQKILNENQIRFNRATTQGFHGILERLGLLEKAHNNPTNALLDRIIQEIQEDPRKRLECEIETGMRNARSNWRHWKKRGETQVADEDFKRICSTKWIQEEQVLAILKGLRVGDK